MAGELIGLCEFRGYRREGTGCSTYPGLNHCAKRSFSRTGSARNCVTGDITALSEPSLNTGPAPLVLPQAANLVYDLDPATLALADTNPIPLFADSKSGIQCVQATGAIQPRLVANAVNGHPGVHSDGTQWMSIPTPGILKTTIDSETYTIIDVVIGVTANNTYGCTGGASNGGQKFYPSADGARVGYSVGYGVGNTATTIPAGPEFNVFGWTSKAQDCRFYSKGTLFNFLNYSTASDSSFGFLTMNGTGVGTTLQTTMTGTFIRRFVWNVPLTVIEYATATKAIYDYYGVVHPTATTDHFYIFDGDSLEGVVGCSQVEKTLGYQLAALLGIPTGTWSVVGIGGLQSSQVLAKASTDVDGLAAVFGKTAIITFQERANDMLIGKTLAETAANHTAYITGRKAANPGCKIIGSTPSDWASSYNAQTPDAWNQYLITSPGWASIGYDGIARVDLNANVGKGASWNTYPESGTPTGIYYDVVHFTDYVNQAQARYTAIQALR